MSIEGGLEASVEGGQGVSIEGGAGGKHRGGPGGLEVSIGGWGVGSGDEARTCCPQSLPHHFRICSCH